MTYWLTWSTFKNKLLNSLRSETHTRNHTANFRLNKNDRYCKSLNKHFFLFLIMFEFIFFSNKNEERFQMNNKNFKILKNGVFCKQCGMLKFYINTKISIHITFFRLVFQNLSFFKIKSYLSVKQKMLHHPNWKK